MSVFGTPGTFFLMVCCQGGTKKRVWEMEEIRPKHKGKAQLNILLKCPTRKNLTCFKKSLSANILAKTDLFDVIGL